MESLLTRCPRCKSSFYKNLDGGDNKTKVEITCPYCNVKYEDMIEEKRVKEHEFYWEIYSGLYPSIKSDNNKDSRLYIGAGLLLFTLPFFIYGLSLFLYPENLANFSTEQRYSFYGIGLVGGIFLIFVISGIISAIKNYSFVISLSGVIFAMLSSFLWYYMVMSFDVNLFTNFSQIYLTIPHILSIITLTLFVKNRKSFRIGY